MTTLDINATLSDVDEATMRRILATRIRALLIGREYAAEVEADDPLLYWRLGETSGITAFDSSPNNNNGTYGDPATPATSPTLGVAGLLVGDADTAISFDPATDLPVASNDPMSALGTNMPNSTWEFWIKTSAAALTGVAQLLYVNGDGSLMEINYDPATDVLGAAFFDTELGGDAVAGDVEGHTTVNLNDGNPHHVVVRVDSTTTFAIFVDGVSKTITYASQVQLDAPSTPAGAQAVLQVYPSYIATMDEVAVYDHRLSDAEIVAHYNAGRTRPTPTVDDLVDNVVTATGHAITDLQAQITEAKSLVDSLAQIAP